MSDSKSSDPSSHTDDWYELPEFTLERGTERQIHIDFVDLRDARNLRVLVEQRLPDDIVIKDGAPLKDPGHVKLPVAHKNRAEFPSFARETPSYVRGDSWYKRVCFRIQLPLNTPKARVLLRMTVFTEDGQTRNVRVLLETKSPEGL